MEGDLITVRKSLRPLSWLYGIGVGFRNLLFEMKILKSESFSVPVISVGNITVGGTGKTPHVEYLIRLLKDHMKVAVLSRGYKRKSHGFIIADEQTTMEEIGDEPFQIKQKFPDIVVAVDKKRTRGIKLLTDSTSVPDVDVILLDDAFQHRYVRPGINILLVDYHRLVIYDELLPSGRLREPVKSKDRADIVIITKCPTDLKPMEFRVITKAMNLYAYQHLFFSTHEYEDLSPVFPEFERPVSPSSLAELKGYHVLLLTGIASPDQMLHDIQTYSDNVQPLAFSDHHDFRQKDCEQIDETFRCLPEPRIIITTEKDATRLMSATLLSDEVKRSLFVLPIHIKLLLDQEDSFNKNIIGYVRKNSRNSILVKEKDDHKSNDSNRSGDRPRTISFRNY